LEEWNGRDDGRIRYAFAPRFAVSCTRELLSEVSRLAREHNVMIHTHASENRTEIEMVERETGMRNVIYLDSLGLTGSDVALAHCVHLDDAEIDVLARTNTHVLHCPSSNLKLGSGIARVAGLIERGVQVSLGADGAPCNNRLDMLTEMRTAALLQKVLYGTEALPARRALRMATIEGARALRLESEIGSLETGKRADVIIINMERLHTSPSTSDTISMIVYAAQGSDVETVLIDGRLVMLEGKLLTLNELDVMEEADREAALLCERAGLS
jgi:5-methylthioadenosine/S-adenosylhomocysteine deaminase